MSTGRNVLEIAKDRKESGTVACLDRTEVRERSCPAIEPHREVNAPCSRQLSDAEPGVYNDLNVRCGVGCEGTWRRRWADFSPGARNRDTRCRQVAELKVLCLRVCQASAK